MTQSLDSLIPQAEAMLGEKIVEWQALESQHTVLRCTLPADQPVIVKHVTSRDDWNVQRFRNECASLSFLREVGASNVPRLVEANVDQQILITADAGTQPDVKQILQRHDRSRAESALMAYAEAMARVQASTVGQRAILRRINKPSAREMSEVTRTQPSTRWSLTIAICSPGFTSIRILSSLRKRRR